MVCKECKKKLKKFLPITLEQEGQISALQVVKETVNGLKKINNIKFIDSILDLNVKSSFYYKNLISFYKECGLSEEQAKTVHIINGHIYIVDEED